jgi:hypothetical protein
MDPCALRERWSPREGEDALGGFAGRLRDAIRNNPEVTRRGVLMAWTTWGVLFVLACSPLDPLAHLVG